MSKRAAPTLEAILQSQGGPQEVFIVISLQPRSYSVNLSKTMNMASVVLQNQPLL